jgi:hypothetical protein
MDRSFLSQPEVVAASRSFVCIRLATYESEEEARVLKSFFTGGSGQLENTTFALLDPEGKRPLVATGRGPNFAFHGTTAEPAKEMAQTMQKIAAYYKVTSKSPAPEAPLPLNGSLRLALNVAACDNLPLVVIHAPDAAGCERLKKTLAPLSWSNAFIGRAVYAVQENPAESKSAGITTQSAGLTVVAPDAYGQEGKILAEIPPGDGAETLKTALAAALEKFVPQAKDARTHIAEGHQRGIYWKTLLPDTDPGPPGGRGPGF